MKGIIASIVFIGALAAIGQQPKPKAPPAVVTPPAPKVDSAKPPVVPDALQKRFFKAEWEFQQANDQANAATQAVKDKQAVLQTIVTELTAACGEKFQPSMSRDRDPECVPKPPAAPIPQPPKK